MAADIAAVLTASITDFKAKMAEADVSVKTLADSGSSNMSKLSSIGKGALLGIGAAVVGVGIAAVDFGDKLEASQASLQTALHAAGISWDSVKSSVAATGQEAQHYGFTQAQVDAALAQGVISTQSYSQAHKILGIAIDVAAVKHVSLQQAMLAVTKASEGQSRALKQLGIDLPVVQTNALKLKQAHDALSAAQLQALSILSQYPDALDAASKHHAAYQAALDKVTVSQTKLKEQQAASGEILDALSKRLSGQAAAAADTFAGRIAAAKAEGENLTAQLGLRLLPVLEAIVTALMNVVNWFIQHKSAAEAVGIAIGVLVAGPLAAYIAGMAAAAAETVIATLPILAIIAAVALVGVGIYELATHWKQVWTDIKNWTDDATQWIRDHMLIVMAIPIVGWLLVLAANWKTVFNDVKAAVTDAWSVIQPIFNLIKSAIVDQIQAAIVIFQGVWQAAWTYISLQIQAAKDVIGAIIAAISFSINSVKDVINALETAWNAVWGALSSAVQTMWSIVSPIFDAISKAANTVASAVGAVKGAIGGIAGAAGGIASTLTGGLLAGGGPAMANVPYIVGESGPELFIPSASGVVVPNGSFGPTGGTPISGGAAASATPAQVNLQIDGQTFARVILPALQTQASLYQRTVPLPVFGVSNVA